MSRDIKGTSLNELNDGLERAIKRAKNQLNESIAKSQEEAIKKAIQESSEKTRRMGEELNTRVSKVSQDLGNRIEKVQRQLGAKIDQQSKEISLQLEEMDRQHSLNLLNLSDTVNNAIEKQNKHIITEVNRLDKNINILSNGLQSIANDITILTKEVDNRFNQQEEAITRLKNSLQSLLEKQNNNTNNKLLAAGAALALLESVRERTNVSKFAPREILDRIALKEKRLRSIGNNPDSCTISDANDLIDEIIVMENEAIRRRCEWEPKHNATLSAAIAVLKLLEQAENIKVPSLYEEGTEEELKADYWTHGAYKQTIDEIKKLKIEIDNMPPDLMRLKEIQDKVASLQQMAEKLIIEASELGTLSEQRVIISNDILNAMIRQGWELKEEPDFLGGIEESDWREGTFAILRKPGTGEEISILILPEEKNGKKGNQIIFHRNDELNESAGAFQSRMEEIKREIEKSGYKLGELREPRHGDGKVEQLRRAADMRQKGAAKKLQQTLSVH
ncbi:MAG: hypothetical protein IAA73_09410 [Bacteroidetes bacterium]|uniref:Uncharacterized protein n=1 Tax=Candidatus Gallipaludibacter merdavium TaxID=2840839 RepID=A0A9D9N544_9BACT|nr:hypothetical protein [Candidatus Gallipaludibacter merdavium]